MTRLLLVEDSPFDAELVQATLAAQGPEDLQVQRVKRLCEAVELLQQQTFDVILLDLTLPDAWGNEVFERVQETAPDTPVVILTGLADPELALTTVRRGAQDYLIKDEVQDRALLRALAHAIERKRLQLEAQRLRQEALEMERRKSEFLATVSHELRNPMTGIVGFIELLRKTALSSLQSEYVEAVHNSSRAMLGMLNGLLDLSSAEAGHVQLDLAPMALRDCLENLAAFIVPQARARSLEVVCGVDPMLPDEVLGDHLRLRQILLNFLGNALKFTSSGYVGLFARVRSLTQDTVVVRFVVEDSGRGIPADKKEQIFSPFKQTRSDDRAQGVGLGLSISKRLIAAMGGVLGVESAPGHGTAFWFDLPFAVRTPSSLLGRLQGIKILLGETHAPTIEAVTFAIHRMGGETEVVGTLEEVRRRRAEFGLTISRWAEPGCVVPSYERDEGTVARPLRLKELHSVPVARTQSRLAGASEALEFLALVVDDEPLCRQLVVAVLEERGARCLGAADAAQALTLIRQHRFDLILLDQQLPDMGGAELARRIRPLQDCPVLAVSGSFPALASEFDAILPKPVSPEQLLVWLEPEAERLVDFQVLERFRKFQKGANRNLIRDLVDTFREGAPRRVRALVEASSLRRNAEITRLAHQLRGAAGSVGAVGVSHWCQQLEQNPTQESVLYRLQRDLVRTLRRLGRVLRQEGVHAESTEAVPTRA